MTTQEARVIVATLIAAFPREAIERPTEELYTVQLSKLDSPTAARDTVQMVIDHYPAFPTIAEFRREYISIRRREAEAQAHDRGLEEPAGGPLPDWVRDYAQRLGTPEPEAGPTVDQLDQLEPGRCDDCGDHSSSGAITAPRFRYNKLALCRPCASSRLRVSTETGVTA